MKRCPTCQRTYADDTLSFCLQDGARLFSESGAPSSSFDPNATLHASASQRSNASTEVLDERSPQTEEMPPTIATQQQPPRITSQEIYGTTPPKTQNTKLVVGLTVIATLILLALGGVGAWLLLRDDKTASKTPQQVKQDQNDNTLTPAKDANIKTNEKPNAKASPSAATTPTPAPVDVAAVREQVTAVLNGWTSASRARDLDKHMSYYADTLDTYYSASNVGASRVRSDRSKAYTAYNTLDVELSDIKITPDPSGERATATFDKTWTFEGAEKYSSGSVHQKVWLTKIGGRWRITGEKDLQVYYVNRER
jgi:hypothetical protein